MVTVARNSYPARAMLRAGELRQAGFTPTEIAPMLSREFGTTPHRTTVRRWTDGRVADRKREEDTAYRRRVRVLRSSGRLGSAHHLEAFQVHRAAQLVEVAGLAYESAARVMEFDYPGSGWTHHRFRRLFGPARARKAA